MYPTRDLIFLKFVYTTLRPAMHMYTEKSSPSWGVSRYTIRKHSLTGILVLVVFKAYSCDDSMLMLCLNVLATALTWCITPSTSAKSPCTSAIGVTFACILLAKILTDYILVARLLEPQSLSITSSWLLDDRVIIWHLSGQSTTSSLPL